MFSVARTRAGHLYFPPRTAMPKHDPTEQCLNLHQATPRLPKDLLAHRFAQKCDK